MCGIAGWIDWDKDLSTEGALIKRMGDTLRFRGPDAEGQWLSPRAALAHRRLIVIDPESGSQPMVWESGGRKLVITFNGEIYNFQELRAELETKGHTFRSRSDTEVILQAYAQWGEACVQHLNGIFAFGLWDVNRQQLFLARDHLGVKPLFYSRVGSAFLFGSEMKALLSHPLVKPEVNAEGLAEIFSLAPVHSPGVTAFRMIRELRAGHWMTVSRERVRTYQYWKLSSAPHTDDLETTTLRIRELLQDAVKRQLVADVPVVSMLSGGLDSSGIAAMAALEFRRQGRKLNTYSVDFVDSAKHFKANEMHLSLDMPWALKVAEHAGTEQHTVIVDSPELLKNLLAPLAAHDVPGLGEMETSLYLLFKEMKKDATVALSGESADEVFGGYPWFHREDVIHQPTFPWAAMFQQMHGAQGGVSWYSDEVAAKAKPVESLQRRYQEALEEVPRLSGEDASEARRRELFYLNLTRWLPILLDRKDRNSMAAGFEVRVPFCDYRLVEYVWNIPWPMKCVDNIEKGILRRAFSEVLPDDIRNRRKSPYPSSQNPTYLQGVRDWSLQILNDPQAPIRPYVNQPVAQALAQGKRAGLPAEYALRPLERLIQINAWLADYHVTVS